MELSPYVTLTYALFYIQYRWSIFYKSSCEFPLDPITSFFESHQIPIETREVPIHLGEGHRALRVLGEAVALGLPVDVLDGLLPQRRGSAAQIFETDDGEIWLSFVQDKLIIAVAMGNISFGLWLLLDNK